VRRLTRCAAPNPQIALDPWTRADRDVERVRPAEAADARAVTETGKAAENATVAATRHRTNLALLIAASAEQIEGRGALTASTTEPKYVALTRSAQPRQRRLSSVLTADATVPRDPLAYAT
jgi:hypothetical protein